VRSTGFAGSKQGFFGTLAFFCIFYFHDISRFAYFIFNDMTLLLHRCLRRPDRATMHLRRAHDRDRSEDAPARRAAEHPAPLSTRLRFLLGMLVLHGAVVLTLHWGMLWYRAPARPLSVPLSVHALRLFHQTRPEKLSVDARRSGPERRACADRLALYFTPRATQPRLEDFDFMVNALRVWKATQHDALLFVFAEPDSPSHKPLAKACQALSHCVARRAPRNLAPNATVARLVSTALQTLSIAPAANCVPTAGVVLYAPAAGGLGASLDSRALFQYNTRNSSRCIDTQQHACMAFAWG